MPAWSCFTIACVAQAEELSMQSVECLRPSVPMDCIATVLKSNWLTPTIKSIALRLDCDRFHFLPGQSVWPRFQRQGKLFSKIYSIASSPSRCPEIELCVSRVGWSSAAIQDLPPGATISLRGPYGLMTLNQVPDRPRLYIAEGSGIAPLKSHIDWLYEQGYRQDLWLIQGNPETVDCLPYRHYWRSLQASWPRFHYLEATHTSPEQVLRTEKLPLAALEIDICAVGDRPSHLLDAVLALGAKSEQSRSESFYAF